MNESNKRTPLLNNRNELKQNRRHLRSKLTPAEALMWKILSRKGLQGYKFRRQHSFGPYILDFYCPQKWLAIELDGDHHTSSDGIYHDTKRDEYLASFDIHVLRYANETLWHAQSSVVSEILEVLESRPDRNSRYNGNYSTTPTPPFQGGEYKSLQFQIRVQYHLNHPHPLEKEGSL